MPADPPLVVRRPRDRASLLVVSGRLVSRLGWVLITYGAYGLQLLALAAGARAAARTLLALAASCALRALGIEVIADERSARDQDGTPCIHIYNHASPFDVLAIQANIRIPSITTSSLHLGRIFPFFQRSAANAGHVLLDHRLAESRRSSLWQASALLSTHRQIFLAPNGSLVTPITKRASSSALLLARRHGATIIPWWFEYRGMEQQPAESLYKPLELLRWRLMAPRATLRVRRGRPEDLALPSAQRPGTDRQAFSQAVMAYYSGGSAETAGPVPMAPATLKPLNPPPAAPG